MEKALIKGYIAKRVAKEFKDGDFVNLGIGLPTMVPAYLPEDVHVILQAEVGMAGQGGKPEVADPNVVDAGGQPSSIAPGGAFIDSATSFGLIRGGHVNATVLGALQVDEKGNLANWIIPARWCLAWRRHGSVCRRKECDRCHGAHPEGNPQDSEGVHPASDHQDLRDEDHHRNGCNQCDG